MIFRDAIKGDEEAILNLVQTVLEPYGLKLEPDGADFDIVDLEKYYFNNNGWFSVVIDKNKIVGSVGIYKIDDSECELRKMYIYEEYQGRGIGKQLMDMALIKAKELGYTTISLQTNSLLTKALPLYKKYGFEEVTDCEVCSRCDILMKKHI